MRVATVLEIREIKEQSEKVKRAKIVRELRRKSKAREKSANVNKFSKHKSFTIP